MDRAHANGDGDCSVEPTASVRLHLDVARCPTCEAQTVITDIVLGRTPTLTCLMCGRTSAPSVGRQPEPGGTDQC